MKKIGFSIILIVAFFCFACKATQTEEKSGAQNTKHEEAPKDPQAKVPVVNFSTIEPLLHPGNDSIFVFNFWATWCAPCVKELPYFEELYAKKKDQKFKLYLISLDFLKQVETKLVPFMEKHQLQGEVMVIKDPDPNTWIDKVSPEWSGAIPITLVVQGDKQIFHEGELSSVQEIESLIQQL